MRLAALTCLYGVRDQATQLANHRACANALAGQGIDLWTVEGLFPWQQAALTGDRRIEVTIRDYLWHKERLLQIGVQRLPDYVDAVLLIDADVSFDHKDIRGRIEQVLEKYQVCQPWSHAIFLDEQRRPLNGPIDVTRCRNVDLGRWMSEVPQFLQRSMAAENFGQRGYVRAHPGLAWAVRREWFDAVGLYQFALGGNGDETLAEGCWGVCDATARANYSTAQWAHVLPWIASCFRAVQGNVGYVPGTVRHLWHGSIRSRGYREREYTMVTHGYDPERHLVDAPDEALAWSPEAPAELVDWWKHYLTKE